MATITFERIDDYQERRDVAACFFLREVDEAGHDTHHARYRAIVHNHVDLQVATNAEYALIHLVERRVVQLHPSRELFYCDADFGWYDLIFYLAPELLPHPTLEIYNRSRWVPCDHHSDRLFALIPSAEYVRLPDGRRERADVIQNELTM